MVRSAISADLPPTVRPHRRHVPASTEPLRDGTVMVVRRLTPADYHAVLALHEGLSSADRYLRFFTYQPTDLAQLAGLLTDPGVPGCALGAFDRGHLAGVAHYALTDADTADAAVAVAGSYRSRGVATALLRRLAAIARADGIRVVTADVLTRNYRMLRLLDRLGWPCRRTDYGAVTALRIEIGDHRAAPTDAAFQRGLSRWADLTFGEVGWALGAPRRHPFRLAPLRRIRARVGTRRHPAHR